ncbi:hypothetical protein [Parafilimonas sp.]|uniref:hypothetical protein n=1 Tax=Parafilimonas sp. TaxID=1969739 RepID=UPI0039E230CC
MMIKTGCCILAITLSAFAGIVYTPTWTELQAVRFRQKYNDEVKGNVDFPDFPSNIKKMEGRLVKVAGYIIPWDETGESVAISANPNKTCYFCGNAGPLSVMDVKLRNKKQRFKVDEFRTFTGTLELNDSDIHQLFYVLNDAAPVK